VPQPTSIFLEPIAKPLLILHAALAVALLGSVVHLGWESVYYLLGRPRSPRLAVIHSRVGFVLYASQFLLGILIYPTYRVRVRHDVFDVRMPWASNLFDTKEMFAAFGLAAFAALFVLSFVVRPREEADRAWLPALGSLGVLVAAITIYSALAGWILVSHRAV